MILVNTSKYITIKVARLSIEKVKVRLIISVHHNRNWHAILILIKWMSDTGRIECDHFGIFYIV